MTLNIVSCTLFYLHLTSYQAQPPVYTCTLILFKQGSTSFNKFCPKCTFNALSHQIHTTDGCPTASFNSSLCQNFGAACLWSLPQGIPGSERIDVYVDFSLPAFKLLKGPLGIQACFLESLRRGRATPWRLSSHPPAWRGDRHLGLMSPSLLKLNSFSAIIPPATAQSFVFQSLLSISWNKQEKHMPICQSFKLLLVK